MTAEVYEPEIDAPNYERFQASMRIYGSPTALGRERERLERVGAILPRYVLWVGKIGPLFTNP